MKLTKPTSVKQIKRDWHLVDANEKIVGRLATGIALKLMGKSKPYFVRNLDCGDHVVVVNASGVKVTGNKETQKVYTRYSGYTAGLKKETFKSLRERKPEEIILRAVSGMLPKNKLRSQMLKRLHVFSGEDLKYSEKFKNQKN